MRTSTDLQGIRELINRGTPRSWKKASYLLWNRVEYPNRVYDAHFWMTLVLVQTLLGHDSTQWLERAEKCPNWIWTMEGDWLRDEGLAALRAGNLRLAGQLFRKARPFHKRSINRRAVLHMAWARLFYAKGDYHKAWWNFQKAHALWSSIQASDPEQADRQWMENNAFHWLKERARSSASLPNDVYELLKATRSLSRKARVLMITRLGKTGDRIDSLFIQVTEVLR